MRRTKALLQHPFRPCIPRKTWCNNVERWVISRSFRQKRQYLRHFEEASWPCVPYTTILKSRNGSLRTTVDEEQRDGTLDGAPLVHVMHAQFAEPVHRDRAREHGKHVQLALVRAPFIPVLPSVSEPFDVCERRAVVPLGCVDLVWQACVLELTLEQRERVIWDGYLEGLFNIHGMQIVACA